jgi:signal transduction histidine kinase
VAAEPARGEARARRQLRGFRRDFVVRLGLASVVFGLYVGTWRAWSPLLVVLGLGGLGALFDRRGWLVLSRWTALLGWALILALGGVLTSMRSGLEYAFFIVAPAFVELVPTGRRGERVALFAVTVVISVGLSVAAWRAGATDGLEDAEKLAWLALHIIAPVRVWQTTRMVARAREDEIAASRRAADVARAAQEEAEAAARHKDELIRNLSHELRTPLAGLVALAEGGRAREGALGEAAALASRALERVRDLLDYDALRSSGAAPRAVRFALGTPIRRVVEQTVALSRSAATVEVDLAEDLWVSGDPGTVERTARHLLENALRHGRGGWVRLSAGADGARAWLKVEDDGPGIPAEARARAIAPFVQLSTGDDRARGGTGLGLAIVRGLALRAGGGLELGAAPAGGLRVEVSWGFSRVETPPEARALSNLRVLVVDDERLNRKVVSALLERRGHRVELAEHGAAAVDRVEDGAFDLVLMDLQMPVMDGLTATRAIKARPGAPPVVALTANALVEDRERCLEAGMDAFLTKPLRASALEDTLAGLGLGAAPPGLRVGDENGHLRSNEGSGEIFRS